MPETVPHSVKANPLDKGHYLHHSKHYQDLDDNQFLAVTHLNGPAEVIAGPGSGKTRVLVRRLLHLVEYSSIPPSSILTITFTKAAALEMKSRASSLLGDKASAIRFGTFHSIFFQILRHTYRFSSDNIISARIQTQLIEEILNKEKIEVRDLSGAFSALISEISQVKSTCSNYSELAPSPEFESSILSKEQFALFFNRYTRRMMELKLIDFDDMSLRCLNLFQERPRVLDQWRERFPYILIDEFQDIDPVQFSAVKALASPRNNLFVVGDDDQAIYGFRGSDPSIMRDFEQTYPHAAIIRLSTNYRSRDTIVRAAGAVISENKNRLAKEIRSGRKESPAGQGKGSPCIKDDSHKGTCIPSDTESKISPCIKDDSRKASSILSVGQYKGSHCIKDDSHKGTCIPSDTENKISPCIKDDSRGNSFPLSVYKAERRNHGLEKEPLELVSFQNRSEEYLALKDHLCQMKGGLNDIAILLRTNALTSYAAEKLASFNIPFRCKERISNIYEHFIARDILDYLHLASGVTLRSTMYRVMNHPYRMISRNAIPGDHFSFPVMRKYHAADPSTLSAISKLERDLNRLGNMNPFAAVHYILHGMGYLKHLKEYAARKNTPFQELSSVAEELKERAKGFRSFEAWFEAIEDYSRAISLIKAGEKGEKNPDKQAVTLMTLHSAKGLEFKEVFLLDINEGIVPYRSAILNSEVEEERRLFYVGMTRAKDILHIWCIRDHFGKKMDPSRFLNPLTKEPGQGNTNSGSLKN